MKIGPTVPRWHGRVNADGTRIDLVNPTVYRRWLKTLAGTFVTITVERLRKKRSNSQNHFWWGVVIPLVSERLGYLPSEAEAVHDAIMRELVGLRPDCHPKLQIRVSSTRLTTAEFSKLIDAAQIWAATEIGVVIPDPDPEHAFRKAPDARPTARPAHATATDAARHHQRDADARSGRELSRRERSIAGQ